MNKVEKFRNVLVQMKKKENDYVLLMNKSSRTILERESKLNQLEVFVSEYQEQRQQSGPGGDVLQDYVNNRLFVGEILKANQAESQWLEKARKSHADIRENWINAAQKTRVMERLINSRVIEHQRVVRKKIQLEMDAHENSKRNNQE
jgi:flagellar biosynthesis chaperone FliJ